MKLKYRVVLSVLAVSLVLGLGGYAANLAYIALAGLVLFILSLLTMVYSDKNDRSIISILIDGVLFGII